MTDTRPNDLIHDWNADPKTTAKPIQFDDETLRDGLQSPSARDPELARKIELVHLMDKLGIHSIAELTKYAIREGLTPLD